VSRPDPGFLLIVGYVLLVMGVLTALEAGLL
jgi:hypothetical protein